MSLADDDSLIEWLRFAVPVLVAHLVALPARSRRAVATGWRSTGALMAGHYGDALMFRNSPAWRPRTANTGQHLAQALAAAVVLHPDGVNFGPLHWCVQPTCRRCNPAADRPPLDVRAINNQLERLDAEYRQLAGLPPWQPPANEPAPAPAPPALRRRPVVDAHLPGVS